MNSKLQTAERQWRMYRQLLIYTCGVASQGAQLFLCPSLGTPPSHLDRNLSCQSVHISLSSMAKCTRTISHQLWSVLALPPPCGKDRQPSLPPCHTGLALPHYRTMAEMTQVVQIILSLELSEQTNFPSE